MTAPAVVVEWYEKYLSHPEAISLLLLLALGTVIILTVGVYLSPVVVGLVFAFALNDLVKFLARWRISHLVAVSLVTFVFVSISVVLFLLLIPLITDQLREFVAYIPEMVTGIRHWFNALGEMYPEIISSDAVSAALIRAQAQMQNWGTAFLQQVIGQIPIIFVLIVFVFLVPLSLFFLLKDRAQIKRWAQGMLPQKRASLNRVGDALVVQLKNYITGKFIEIVVVGLTTFVVMSLLGLEFTALLSLLVGLSVLVPFVGAAVVTVPIAAVAFLQFGWTLDFAYVVAAYLIIQALDGNILVPLLFAEAVKVHPIAILCAILAFGGLWGIWGVVFAIPLAILIKTLMQHWPVLDASLDDTASESG